MELYVRVSRIGDTSIGLDMAIYPKNSDRLLTTMEVVYVGFDAKLAATRPVPDEIRELVDHFEATGEVLALDRFPNLAEAAR